MTTPPTQPLRQAVERIETASRSGASSLDLSFLGLTGLPSELFQLTQLTSLNLANNALVAIPPQIFQLSKLQALNLTNNPIGALPDQLYTLRQLQVLRVGGTRRQVPISQHIGGLTQLRQLYWWSNNLTSLPREIGQLVNLQQLHLYDNQLSVLPTQIGNLTQLTTLDLAYNLLTALPPHIGQLANLTTLNLRANQLVRLVPELQWLNRLETLHLEDNPLHFPQNISGPEAIRKALSAYFDFNPPTQLTTRIFITYARQDQSAVQTLYQIMNESGHQVWMDVHSTPDGEDPARASRKALSEARILIACLSQHSVDRSGRMQGEMRKTFEMLEQDPHPKLRILPLRLENCPYPERMAAIPTLDWFKSGSPQVLLDGIQGILRRG